MLNFLLRICLVTIVLDSIVIFFSSTIGVFILAIAVAGLLFAGRESRRLMRGDVHAFEALSKKEKERELNLEDLPATLIIVLIAAVIISNLGFFGFLSFNPILNAMLAILTILLLVYYFLQKRRLQKQKSLK